VISASSKLLRFCREKRGISFRIAYSVFQSILKVGYGFEWLAHGGKILN
jgi:hypothetical protein